MSRRGWEAATLPLRALLRGNLLWGSSWERECLELLQQVSELLCLGTPVPRNSWCELQHRMQFFFLAAADAAFAPRWAVVVLEAAALPWGSQRTFSLELFCPNTSQVVQGLLCLSGLVFSTLSFPLLSAVFASVCKENVCLQVRSAAGEGTRPE